MLGHAVRGTMTPMAGRLDEGSEAGRTVAASLVVPCPVLVGRASEAASLGAALDIACEGRGGVVFVVGEAGIGKSRLVHEVSSMAAVRGARVLRGRAVPGSGGAAFRALSEALAPVVAETVFEAELAPWLPALAAILPTVSSPAAVEVNAPVRGEAVVRLLSSLCAEDGGLLVLEDLHWADPETVAVVEHLSDHLERAAVLCVATVRSAEASAARDLVRRVAARRTSQVLELARLNPAQVAAMVHSCTGGSSTETVERVASLAEGVPFLVEEILASPGLPASFAESVEARLAELPEGDRRVLLVAAAFGRQFDWRLLSAATGVAEGEVIDALDRGVAAQLLAVEGDGFRFRHALTAEAVLQSVIPPRRAACAAAALAALDGAYGELPPELREMAAQVAERAGQHERAGRLHLELGDEALERGALHTAVAALERAAQLLPHGDAWNRAREWLIDALLLAGRVDDALAIGHRLAAGLPAPRAAAVHLRLAGAAATAARWPVARDHLAASGALVDPTTSPALRAELSIREAEVALGTNDTPRAEQQARDALEVSRSDGLHEQECEALQLLGRCARRSSLEAAERWFREALAAAESHGLVVWRLRALHEVGTIALLERCEVDALLEAQRLAERLGAMATVSVLDIEIAAGCAGRDDFDGQARHGEEAIRRGKHLGLDLIVAYGWQHVAVAAALRGDRARVATAAAEAQAAAPGNQDLEGLLVGGELLAALVADDLEGALALASRLTERLRGSETAPPAHHRAAWPVLLAVAGRPEAAAAIEEIKQAGVAVNPGARGWLTLARAIVAGRTEPDRAAALAVEADAQLVHMPMWRNLARRLAAEAAAVDGWQIPDGWLTDAEACLRRLGFPAAAQACRRLRGAEPGAVPPAWARLGITRREADVLTLIVDGCSNRAIADRLYLSVRTVEKHVESLLRKTATKTRTQLAREARTT
jgi:DNA-binding CsgD family transcriptional regulator/tetratricopeptide (TPR) repeat protein